MSKQIKDAAAQQQAVHMNALITAAAISRVVVVCHSDTWTTIRRRTFKTDPLPLWLPDVFREFFDSGNEQPQDDGTVRVTLSGPHLAKVIHSTRRLVNSRLRPVTVRAVASRVYQDLTAFVATIDPSRLREGDVPVLTIDAASGPQGASR